MQRHLVIVLPALAAVVLAAGPNDGSATDEAIARAVRAPYEAYFAQDAPALCADFTPTVSEQLVANAPAGSTCESAVAEVFKLTAPYQPRVPKHLPADWTVGRIVQHGALAAAVVRYGTEGTASFKLQRIEGKWLIATHSHIITVSACDFTPHPTPCPPTARIRVFLITPPNPSPAPIPAVPGAVERAGGHELSAFKTGRTVYDQSGCAACHRIDDQGNKGPGPNLTHVGSALSKPEIERAIVDPSEPMPSFKNLPAKKLRGIVEFLSLLR
jgi:hypothetical protein